jgi:hypothetical protein
MNELISQVHFDFTKPLFADGILNVFIHKSCEPKALIGNMLAFAENVTNVDFKIVKKQWKAELKIFETKLIKIQGYEDSLGLAVPQYSSTGNSWDLYVKRFTGSMKKWIYLHEFGHFLGMEHPHEGNDGDIWENQTSNDTVMSYNYRQSSYWWFRQADIDTITGMWVG